MRGSTGISGYECWRSLLLGLLGFLLMLLLPMSMPGMVTGPGRSW